MLSHRQRLRLQLSPTGNCKISSVLFYLAVVVFVFVDVVVVIFVVFIADFVIRRR